MQSNLEADMPAPSPQTLKAQEALPKNGQPSLQKGLMPERQVPHSIGDDKSSPGAFQNVQAQRQQGMRGRQRPSLTLWRLILVLGDVVLLAALFGLFLIFRTVPHVSQSVSGLWNVKLLWVSLALVSWGLAINMTQSQNLSNASSRFKSPCSTLLGLVLMYIFWTVLSFLLLGIGFINAAGLELPLLALAAPAFTSWRILLAEVMNLPRFRPRAVIVGVNSSGEAIAKELESVKYRGTNVLGYIGDSFEGRPYRDGLPILGNGGMLRYLANNGLIDLIIIALDYKANPELFKEAIEAAQHGIRVLPMAVVYESSTGKVPVEHVGDQWYVALNADHSVTLLYLCWKKILDLACGLCGMLLLCVVMPVIALFIYIDSPGPIFYSQERVGLRGKPFRIYKFRSMYPDAEAEGRPRWATERDVRVTRIGRFMRSTHFDELPQLFNILRGDMSLIGPRPERAEFVNELEKTIPFYRYRLTAKPGLTGWAQVKYSYARTDNDALIKLQYDLYYVKRQSFMLDMFIILKTVAEVLSLRGS
jgi:exopolysaccharide biosynthesis polyprenyl glycosylphosphotransferase